MASLEDHIVVILITCGETWEDNGNLDKVHCACGHRPTMGELHQRHRAKRIVDAVNQKINEALAN